MKIKWVEAVQIKSKRNLLEMEFKEQNLKKKKRKKTQI